MWRGTYNSTTVAIKTFENSGQISTENFIAEFVKLIDLRHKHLTQFVGAVLETRAIITDFMERGDLTNVLFDDSRHITGGEKIEWALHIALAKSPFPKSSSTGRRGAGCSRVADLLKNLSTEG